MKKIKIPEAQEKIVAFAFNSNNIDESKIASKKADFKVIDIYPLYYAINAERIEKANRKEVVNQEIPGEEEIDSINIQTRNMKALFTQFSADLRQITICSPDDYIVKDLIRGKQRRLKNLEGQTCRAIFNYGKSDFLYITAEDKEAFMYVSTSKNSKVIKEPNRFQEGSLVTFHDAFATEVDVNPHKPNIKLIVAKDSETFQLVEYENFKMTFWTRVRETACYQF